MNKSDKQFMIQFDQTNRDFLTNVALFTFSSLMSVTALLASVFSITYSLNGYSTHTIVIAIVFIIAGGLYWIKALPHAKNSLINAKKVNAQLQERLFELYPEYKKKLH